MVLSDSSILAHMDSGEIIIYPFKKENLNPNSVDLTLNPLCKVYDTHMMTAQIHNEAEYVETVLPLDCRNPTGTIEFEIPEEGYVLQPNRIYLYACNEKIGVDGNVCARVEGKSSLGRLGLFIHVTAGWIDAGFCGSLVLELHCVQPIKIYPNMKICQICFMQVHGNIMESYDKKSGSKYMNQTGVQESLMHKNFEK